MWSEWPVGIFSSLKAMEMLTMNPTPKKRSSVVGFPDQEKVYPAPCSWGLSSHEKWTSLKAAMSTFNLDSSCAIRAERRSSRLLWAASSTVLTFQHASFSIFATSEVGAYLPCSNILGPLRRCLLTVASQLGDGRRASVRPHFLGPSFCGANSAVPKEGCLIVQGASMWCCRFKSTPDDQYPKPRACKIGTAAPSDIFHQPFRPFPIATGLGSVGGVADGGLSSELTQWSF